MKWPWQKRVETEPDDEPYNYEGPANELRKRVGAAVCGGGMHPGIANALFKCADAYDYCVALGEGKVSSKTLADILEPPKLLMTDPREAQP